MFEIAAIEAPKTDTVAVSDALPAIEAVGSAVYRLGPFKLYTAELASATGEFDWTEPFALKLAYSRKFSAVTLADASLKEMARLSQQDASVLEPLRSQLEACFTDVQKGDIIVGYSLAEDEAVFTHNDMKTCQVAWPGFRSDFFGIWLSDKARFDENAERLTGRALVSAPDNRPLKDTN